MPAAGPQATDAARAKLLGLRFLMLAFIVLLYAVPRGWAKLETRRWPTAEATILFSEVIERSGKTREWCVQVGYRYSVDGGRQGGAKSWACSASRAGAEAQLAQLRPGQHVRVHYDPAHPERSVAQPASLDALDAFLGLLALILAAVGLDRIRQARRPAAAKA